MAIKIKIQTGALHLNVKAKGIRDNALKPKLKGMKCKYCSENTIISFQQNQAFPGSSSVDYVIDACCPEFDREIKNKLGILR